MDIGNFVIFIILCLIPCYPAGYLFALGYSHAYFKRRKRFIKELLESATEEMVNAE